MSKAGDAFRVVRERMIEDLRLRFEYPGEYVGYLDKYRTGSKLRGLNRHLTGDFSFTVSYDRRRQLKREC